MSRSDLLKLAGVVLVTALAAWFLYPSYTYYSMTPAQRDALAPKKLAELRKQAIHLGLDLQGGLQLLLEVDKSKLTAAEAKDATDRAMEIIRNRVDQFGVAEPLIQREGEDRVAVQLPGLTDRGRAIELIGKTALLEFKLVRTPEETKAAFERLDAYFAANNAAETDSTLRLHPITGRMLDQGVFPETEASIVEKLLASTNLDSILPPDTQVLWEKGVRDIGGVKIAAVGPATAAKLRDLHLQVDLMPAEALGAKIAKEFDKFETIENLKICLLRAEKANPDLPKALEELGAIVDDIPVYQTVAEATIATAASEKLQEAGADWITFTSGSTVEHFHARFNLPALLKKFPQTKLASIGPETTKALEALGLKPAVEAKQHTMEGLVAAVSKASK